MTADEDAGPQARRHGTHPALAFNLEKLAAAVFATLFDDLYVAYHCVYSDDETLSPEGAWALISENTFILDHIFGVPEAVATQAVLGAAIAIGAGFDEWDTSKVVENPAGAAEYWMSKLDRARTGVRTVDELADRLWALSTPTWERVLGAASMRIFDPETGTSLQVTPQLIFDAYQRSRHARGETEDTGSGDAPF